jgi:antitoxin (DNA-binding transcriptional repressor) of toxin-antitoxin stability system
MNSPVAFARFVCFVVPGTKKQGVTFVLDRSASHVGGRKRNNDERRETAWSVDPLDCSFVSFACFVVPKKEEIMLTTVTLEEAEAKLRQLVEQLAPGEEVVIMQNQQPVARLVSERPAQRKPRVPGNCRGMITLLVEDDEHLQDFEEYMR